jgi:thiol:disulfide interchange protein DsbA
MKRRNFSLAAAGAALSLSGLRAKAAQPQPQAQPKKPEAGTDYQVLKTRAPVEAAPGKIEVVEFFWYGCPHCNAFEPMLASWVRKLPKDIVFRRSHVYFRDEYGPQQRLYYALESLGLVEQLHARVFNAIHVQKIDLSHAEAITAWVVKQGIDQAKFLAQYNSFAMATRAKRATQLQDSYKVEGVPALGVAGRYYTDGSMTGTMERALQVVEFLIAEVRVGH